MLTLAIVQILGLRKEAIEMALARKQTDESVVLPAPTKRQSFVTKRRTEASEVRPSSSYIAPTHFSGFYHCFLMYSMLALCLSICSVVNV